MKRALSALFALVMILAAVPVTAEGLDSFTLDELQAAAASIRAEILRRQGEPITLWPGVYIVGQDIPEGTYRVDAVSMYGLFEVYRDSSDMDFPFYSQWLDISGDVGTPTIGRIQLQSNQAIMIGLQVTLTLYAGVE